MGRQCAAAPRRAPEVAEASRRDALEAAKDAKYREIRDAELDWRTGKLSDEDYQSSRTASCAPRRSRSCASSTSYPERYMELLFSVIQITLSVGLILLVLMHSGKDAGLSGAFGVGTGPGSLGGGSLVERNLNRWTVGFAIAFAVNTIILLKAPFW